MFLVTYVIRDNITNIYQLNTRVIQIKRKKNKKSETKLKNYEHTKFMIILGLMTIVTAYK